MTRRMQPTRAGIIGLWDYTCHVFAFADGRIVLRGANGSGKTKALEVLFPFVLDGRLDPRRLDPFSGENRTMKENLLWGRDGESGYGYAWLEFGDGERFVTVAVGMVARRAQPSPTAWFFVADGRVGEEIVLVEPDGRPRTRAQLRDALGEGVIVERARDHRARVDAALFGLGVERYEAMLDLVLTLRRPMLAKDLDPALLSDTLARGLRPLDDGLLEQVARSFDDLEAVQRDLECLAAADDATQAFLTDYRGYLRTQARARADAVIEAEAAAAAASDRLAAAHAGLDRARADEALAEAEAAAARDSLASNRARRDALRDSEAFRSVAQLEHLARAVRDLDGALDRAVAAAGHAGEASAVAHAELDAADRAATEAHGSATRLRSRVAEAAEAAGVAAGDAAWTTADGVRQWVSAAVAARRADVAAVRTRLDAALDAERCVALADDAAARAGDAVERAERDVRAAEERDTAARAELLAATDAWAQVHAGVVAPDDATAVAAAVATFDGAASSTSPANVWRDRLAPRERDAVARRTSLAGHVDGLTDQADALRARRDAIAAERDDAPPTLPWRGGGRDGRPGAPLWRLVRFAAAVDLADAAGIEAALEAAGMLDAWVSPDGSLDTGDDAADAYLDAAAGSPPAATTLAAVLVPEPDAGVPEPVVHRLLSRVAFGGDAETGQVAVSATGGYRLGPLAGRHRVDAPRYIGATARAAHRAARLAALDDEMAALHVEVESARSQLAEVDAWLQDASAATSSMPATGALTDAVRGVDQAAARVREARTHADSAVAAAEAARRTLNDARLSLQREAVHRGVAATTDGVRDVNDAVDRLDGDGRDLAVAIERAAERISAREAASARARLADDTRDRMAADVADRRRDREVRAAELATLRAQIGAAADAVVTELESVESAIARGHDDERRLSDAVQAAAATRGSAEKEVEAAGDIVTAARAGVDAAAARLAVLRRADLAGPLALDVDHVRPAGDVDGAAFLSLVDALVIGVSATDERRKAAQTRVTRALEELEHTLGAAYHPSWDVEDDVIVVTIGDDVGVRSVAAFADGLAAQRADQEVLLHARERALFEDTLLSAVCRQIHERIQSTRDLVATMDGEMRARRLSSGQTVGVAWRAADAATPEWKVVHRLLDGDPAHFGPDELETIRRHFGSEIALARATEPDVAYRELLGRVLDYRTWRRFELTLVEPDGTQAPLTRARHARLSGGEKAASLHLPLFAAAHAAFTAARPDCPRLLALDEAFAGIDDQGRGELLSLTAAFDLDLFMTGFDLWATHPSIRAVAHHDLLHLADDHAVSSLLVLWNGRELVEGADAEQEITALALSSLSPPRGDPPA